MRDSTVVVQSEVLASWLKLFGCTRTQLAKSLGVSKGRISQLLTSKEEPSAHLIAKLMLVTHLPFDRLFKIIETAPSEFSNHGDAQTTAELARS